MYSHKSLSAALLVLVSTLCLLGFASDRPAKADSDYSLGLNPIIGSWRVTVTFDDHRPDVLALYTFDRDRNFTMDGSWPGLFGSGHGAWNRNADNASVDVTFFRLLYSPTEQNEATGALNATFNGTLKVQARLTVSDDQQTFTARYLLANLDPNGNVRSTTIGSLIATRLPVEPLQ